MRKIGLFILVFILPLLSFAQLSLDDISLSNEISHVFYANNSMQEKLMNTKTWIATTFGDYKTVLQFEDDANGRIIIKGKTAPDEDIIRMPMGFNICFSSQYTFTITFDLKEDRFRIKIQDIKYMVGETSGLNAKICIPNTERSLEERIKIAEDNATYTLQKKKEAASTLFEKLRKGDYKRNERETLVSKYKNIELEVKELESNIDERVAKARTNVEMKYKTVFWELLMSASRKISESDDF